MRVGGVVDWREHAAPTELAGALEYTDAGVWREAPTVAIQRRVPTEGQSVPIRDPIRRYFSHCSEAASRQSGAMAGERSALLTAMQQSRIVTYPLFKFRNNAQISRSISGFN